MRWFLLLCLTAVFLSSACSRPKGKTGRSTPPGDPTVHESEQGNFVHVPDDDAAMNAAVAQAKATVGDCVRALHAGNPNFTDFYVKKPYPVPGGSAEHMWITVNSEQDGIIQGEIANDAEETKEVKMGDKVSVKLDEVSDWRYLDGKKMIGGYTIRYFLDRMPPEEKAAFLKEQGFEL